MNPEVRGGGEEYAEGLDRPVHRTSASAQHVAAARAEAAKLMPSLYLSGLPALGRQLRWSWRRVRLVG